MAILPTRILEVEFDAGVWTDVTADLVRLSTQRGRNRESGAFETGTLNFTLRNDARTYDPDYAAGPYSGKLRPNRRARFRATYAAVTYPVFLGYIDRITQEYGGPNDATATFSCSDRFKILNRVELPRSVYVAAVNAAAPDLWFPLGEPAGSAYAVDVGAGKVRAAVKAGTTLGGASLVVRDPGSSMATILGGQGIVVERVTYPAAAISGTGPFSVGGWMAAPAQTDPSGLGTLFYQGGLSDITTFVQVAVLGPSFGADAGKIEFRIGILHADAVRSTVTVTDSAPHHWMATRDAAGRLRIYVDGVDRSDSSDDSVANIPVADMSFGSFPTGGYDLLGSLQHVALWRTAEVTPAQVAEMNAAGRTPWVGDTPGARLARILALAGVAPADYDLDAGATTLQASSLGGTALGNAQKVEETELGSFFVGRDGIIQFIGRHDLVTGYLTPKAVLVDHQGGGLPFRSSSSDVDEASIVTRATVSRGGSVAVAYEDAAAIAEFGLIDDTHEGLLHDSDAYSLSYAQWLVATHRDARSRIGAVALDLHGSPATLYPGILDLELGDRGTYKRQPQNVGATIDADLRVESIAHETGGAYWRTTLQLSPFNPGEDGLPVWVWGTTRWGEHVWGMG